MPITQWILASIPTVPLGIVVVVLAVGLSILGLVLTRRFIPHQILHRHSDFTAALFEAVSLAYMVILAFIVVVSWENFDKTMGHVQNEANELVDMYRDSVVFPPDFGNAVRADIKNYYEVVVTEEWPLMVRGQESIKARGILRDIWKQYASYEPRNEREKIFFSESVSKLNQFREYRRMRLMDSRTGISPVLWFILIFGGILTVGFTFFFTAESFTYNWILVSILAAIVSLVLLTILIFDFPFTGDMKIPVTIYQEIVNF